ncbi:MAG TPA: AI-2E family transporter, partial [Rubrivivax sp.]|nr:AI-2E family transporter [Rubrivivax sp.]
MVNDRMNLATEPWTFPRKVLLVTVAVLLALLAWRLMDLMMLTFGAIILASALRSLARVLEKYLWVPPRWSVMAALLLVTVALTAGLLALGDPLAEQLDVLRQRLPAATEAVMRWLNTHRFGVMALEYVQETRAQAGPWAARIAGFAGLTLGALGSVALMLVMAIYLAVSPAIYVNGLVRLMPLAARERTANALEACGQAVSRWLLGQSISMLFVGSATALGLWLLGVPLA